MTPEFRLLLLIFWAFLSGFIAVKKGRNFFLYFGLTFIITPIATIVLLLFLPKKDPKQPEQEHVYNRDLDYVPQARSKEEDLSQMYHLPQNPETTTDQTGLADLNTPKKNTISNKWLIAILSVLILVIGSMLAFLPAFLANQETKGYDAGYLSGYDKCTASVLEYAYENGYRDGHSDGYYEGVAAGKEEPRELDYDDVDLYIRSNHGSELEEFITQAKQVILNKKSQNN